MRIYFPQGVPLDDYRRLQANGMWYQNWQSGYFDFLKAGHPKPSDPETILAALRSPHTPDFMHGGASDVPFLISARAAMVLEEAGISGYRLANVEIVRVATKGKRQRLSKLGEPEGFIDNGRNVRSEVTLPVLYAVNITGRASALPDFSSGRCPNGHYISPFVIMGEHQGPDLFRPEYQGKAFGAWSFCSEKVHDLVTKANLTNISFRDFDEFMTSFREECRER